LITIRDGQTGELLAGGATTGDSGQLSQQYASNASQRPIITPGDPPQIVWVIPQPTTAQFTAALPLERPTLLAIAAFGSLGGLQTAHRAVTTAWVVPGDQTTISLEIAGLILQVMEPPTHLQVAPPGGTIPLEAKVAMMCGCPIQPGMPWIPSDFAVSVQISQAGNGVVDTVPLSFSNPMTPGIFVGSYTLSEQGYFTATFQALQLSTGNTGAGQATFFLPPPAGSP
jgi:hypothetical protein